MTLLQDSPTPTHDEGPSRRDSGVDPRPAKGLRLPSALSGEPLAQAVNRIAWSLGGEPFQGNSGPGQTQETTRVSGVAGGVAPFLVLEGGLDTWEKEPWTLRDDECPLAGYSSVDRTTGEIAWSATCGSARCYRCSRMVSARSFALARRAMTEVDSKHVRFLTLTLAPEDWQDVRKRMKDLVQFLRRDRGIRVNWLWVVEEGDLGGMKHIHAVQWGDFIPWRDLLGWWGARVQIEASSAAVGYLGKNVIRYLGKNLDGDREGIEDHMNLNGGRAAHWTRGFFAGLGREDFARQHPLPGIYFLQNHPIGEAT
jgi:hypothetical protein